MGLGSLHKDSGNFQKALDNYSQARQIFASLSSRFGEALAIESTGVIYLLLGDPQRAIDNFTQSAPIFSSMGIKSRECTEEDRSNRPSTYTAPGWSTPAK